MNARAHGLGRGWCKWGALRLTSSLVRPPLGLCPALHPLISVLRGHLRVLNVLCLIYATICLHFVTKVWIFVPQGTSVQVAATEKQQKLRTKKKQKRPSKVKTKEKIKRKKLSEWLQWEGKKLLRGNDCQEQKNIWAINTIGRCVLNGPRKKPEPHQIHLIHSGP